MRVVEMQAFDVLELYGARRLIVRYNLLVDGYLKQTGFWRFKFPVHWDDIYERAYIELNANRVYSSESLFLQSYNGMFF